MIFFQAYTDPGQLSSFLSIAHPESEQVSLHGLIHLLTIVLYAPAMPKLKHTV